MPMVTVPSFSSRAHSCEARYLRVAGIFDMKRFLKEQLRVISHFDAWLAVSHKRIFHHAGVQQLVANLDLYAFACDRWDASQTDGALERGRECTASNLAGNLGAAGCWSRSVGQSLNALMTTQDASIFENQSNHFA